MSENLDDKFFDLAVRILNYAIEFVNMPGYASLRLIDVLKDFLELSHQIEGFSRKDFYYKVREKIEGRNLLADARDRAMFLDELLAMFIDEWRKANDK